MLSPILMLCDPLAVLNVCFSRIGSSDASSASLRTPPGPRTVETTSPTRARGAARERGAPDVLEQHGAPEAHTILQAAQEVPVCGLHDVEATLLLHVADPPVRLALRVDHQRPAARLGHDDACARGGLRRAITCMPCMHACRAARTVLHRHAVCRKPRNRPRARCDGVFQRANEACAARAGHVEL
jgi:hypothetical protein